MTEINSKIEILKQQNNMFEERFKQMEIKINQMEKIIMKYSEKHEHLYNSNNCLKNIHEWGNTEHHSFSKTNFTVVSYDERKCIHCGKNDIFNRCKK